MRGKDLDGKRVRYQGKEWLVSCRRICAVDIVTLTEAAPSPGQLPEVVPISEDLWPELEAVDDD